MKTKRTSKHPSPHAGDAHQKTAPVPEAAMRDSSSPKSTAEDLTERELQERKKRTKEPAAKERQGMGPIPQEVPQSIEADSLKESSDITRDEKFQHEIHQREAGEKEALADSFILTREEKIESEYPAELNDILAVQDDDVLAERLAYLQRRLMEFKVPVMIVLEGAYACGKGRITNELLMGLDARSTRFIGTRPPSEDDLMKPFLTQYLESIPSYRTFNIYYRSWYSNYIYYKHHFIARDRYPDPDILLEEIKAFERGLADDGTVIIKFKIHIDPEKQNDNIRKMLASPLTTWKAQEYDKYNNEAYVREMERIMAETDMPYAPWYRIDYTKKAETTRKVMKKVIEILGDRLKKEEHKKEIPPMDRDGKFTGNTDGPLQRVDLTQDICDKTYSKKLKELQHRMREVQHALYMERIPLILVFEGWDAAGKGGAIHRIIANLDPTNYTVNTTAAPNDLEKEHQYLWRFATKFPRAGHIAIWDRSWYGRVMVERVEGFATDAQWNRAYDEINQFEEIMTHYGAIVLKFFLHIDKETQLARFEARQANPAKRWKITDEDWRNREKWDKYTEAVNDMIEKTSTPRAPWFIIEGNSKKYARIRILDCITTECDKYLKYIDYGNGPYSQKKKGK
ncbi:hypothetical protein ABB02_00445 [Clostridiaceae bacterium JG1575]|nr:hypothetical protein ABB02_00445 [Clostridiaceae bacterium JG1575]